MKTCVIVPFRNRYEHLVQFINHMKYSQPNIPIFIINQNNDQLFNRGTLFNIGFHILQNDYDNFIFHDVDLLPININYNSYSKNPQHLSKYVSQFRVFR
jgi:hypothetical protein